MTAQDMDLFLIVFTGMDFADVWIGLGWGDRFAMSLAFLYRGYWDGMPESLAVWSRNIS
jgi:hypothetical protein